MKNKTKKSKSFIFSTYECTAIEEFLEHMAEEGWLLESITGFKFKFNKIEPKKLKYSVELVPEVSNLDAPNSDPALEYREYCNSAGWVYVCEKGKLQVFYTENSSNTISIHTDENEKYKSVLKSSLYDIFLKLLLVFIFSFNLYNSIFIGDISFFLSSNLSILGGVAALLLIVINTIEVISFITWSIKAKIQIAHGGFMPYNTFKQLKIKNLIMKIINIIILCGILAILLASNNQLNTIVFPILMVIGIFLVIFMVNKLTTKFLHNKSYSRKTKLIINAGSIIFTFFLLMFLMLTTTIAVINSPSFSRNTFSNNELLLTLNDFQYNTPTDDDLYVGIDTSLIGKKTFYSGYIDDVVLSYTLFESNYPWAISIVEKSLINSEVNIAKRHQLDFKLVEPTIVDNIKIYSLQSYIIVSDNKVLKIDDSFNNISHEDFISIIYNTIFANNVNLSSSIK